MLDSFEEFVDRVRGYNYRRPVEQVRSSLVYNVKQLPDGKWTWKYDRELRTPEHTYWQEPDLTDRLWGGGGLGPMPYAAGARRQQQRGVGGCRRRDGPQDLRLPSRYRRERGPSSGRRQPGGIPGRCRAVPR